MRAELVLGTPPTQLETSAQLHLLAVSETWGVQRQSLSERCLPASLGLYERVCCCGWDGFGVASSLLTPLSKLPPSRRGFSGKLSQSGPGFIKAGGCCLHFSYVQLVSDGEEGTASCICPATHSKI